MSLFIQTIYSKFTTKSIYLVTHELRQAK